jgi:lactoylglutathione lyase
VPYHINHIHLKSHDPKVSADWWVTAFNFTIVSDVVREAGDRFITCQSEDGTRIPISEPMPGQTFATGDAGLREGLEHFGIDSDDLDADIGRLEGLGATLLDGPRELGAIRIAFIEAPDHVRVELIQQIGG